MHIPVRDLFMLLMFGQRSQAAIILLMITYQHPSAVIGV